MTWVEQQNKAVELLNDRTRTPSAAAFAAELNIEPEEALAQVADLIFLTAAEQVGADYLGGGLAENLFASAEFNKELGADRDGRTPKAYSRPSTHDVRRGGRPCGRRPCSRPHARRLAGVGTHYRRSRRGVHALGPIDLDVEPGSFVASSGPSGCGKTTLLRLVAGFLRPDRRAA